jgi:hypothetical protein
LSEIACFRQLRPKRKKVGVTMQGEGNQMRIMSLKVRSVAQVFAILYAAFSPVIVISMVLSNATYFRIPLGIFAPPLTYLNINFDIQRPEHFLSGVLFMLFGAVCYAATGWLTGAVLVLCFNFIVRRTGGIEASVLTNESLAMPAVRSTL